MIIDTAPAQPFLGGGVPPGYPHPDPISDKKNVIFHTHFQTWTLRNYVIII